MAKTSIIINSTDALGKSSQKTFTDVNPNASNDQLATFGQMLAAVSSNTYNGTTRIDKTDCDTEQKPERTFTPYINKWDEATSQKNWVEVAEGATIELDTRGVNVSGSTGTMQFRLHNAGSYNWIQDDCWPKFSGSSSAATQPSIGKVNTSGNRWEVSVTFDPTVDQVINAKFTCAETADFAPYQLNFTINFTVQEG